MSAEIGSIIACPQIQEDLNLNFTTVDPLGAIEPRGLTDFILSPTNTNGMLQRKISPGGGKKRKVQLLYTPPILAADVNDGATKVCTSSDEDGMLSQDYDLDLTEGSEINKVFNTLNMAEMCKDNSLWFAQRIQAMMDGMMEKIGNDVAAQAALLTGAFGLGEAGVTSNVKTISTRKSDGSFNLDALEDITFAAMNAGYRGVPFIFGFGEIYKYFKRVASGCCATDGIDVAAYAANNQAVFVADKKLKTALGSENFLTLAPGALQLLTWNEFEGANGINVQDSGAFKKMVIVNPKNGVKFDMIINDTCDGLSVSLKLAHKLVGLPADMYQAGSEFAGVTFVNEFAIVNP